MVYWLKVYIYLSHRFLYRQLDYLPTTYYPVWLLRFFGVIEHWIRGSVKFVVSTSTSWWTTARGIRISSPLRFSSSSCDYSLRFALWERIVLLTVSLSPGSSSSFEDHHRLPEGRRKNNVNRSQAGFWKSSRGSPWAVFFVFLFPLASIHLFRCCSSFFLLLDYS